MAKSVVLGASDNPGRFSNKAVRSLLRNGYDPVAVGPRAGNIKEIEILTGRPEIEDVDTILLYLGPQRQAEWYDYVIGLKPKRVIFNPGTNNPEFREMLKEKGIETVEDCALIMLNSGAY
jgi:predicted CoA-binding protein